MKNTVSFLQRTLRLKLQLDADTDQEVAEALGLSKTTFCDCKARDSFPIDRLYSIAAQRPELKLDVDFILNGDSKTPPATPSEEATLAAFVALWTPPTYEEMAAFMDAEMKRMGVGPFAAKQGAAA